MSKKMYVQIDWAEDPAKIKIGQGKKAITLQKHFEDELRQFIGSWCNPKVHIHMAIRSGQTQRSKTCPRKN